MKRVLLILTIIVLAGAGYAGFRLRDDDIFKEKKNLSFKENKEKECKFCHSNKVKYIYLHEPTGEDCTVCHQSTGNPHPKAILKGFTLVEKEPELCYVCHDQNNKKAHLHQPVRAGKCTDCHSPHGSDNALFLAEKDISSHCSSCHNLDLNQKTIIHAPIEIDGCSSCHEVHESDYTGLLKKEEKSLCTDCHESIAEELKSEHIHPPFEDRCSNCHSAHASNEQKLLTSSTPGLCYSCHEGVADAVKTGKTIHSPMQDASNCMNCHSGHSSRNSHYLKRPESELCFMCHDKEIKKGDHTIENIKEKLNISKYKHGAIEAGGCAVCHRSHASEYPFLLSAPYATNDYVITPTNAYDLCFTCHDAGLLTEPETEQATGFRNGNKNLHYVHAGGDKGRNCKFCHDMHASDQSYLIKRRTGFGSWDMPVNFIPKAEGGTCRTGCHIEYSYDRTIAITISGDDNGQNVNTNENKQEIEIDEISTGTDSAGIVEGDELQHLERNNDHENNRLLVTDTIGLQTDTIYREIIKSVDNEDTGERYFEENGSISDSIHAVIETKEDKIKDEKDESDVSNDLKEVLEFIERSVIFFGYNETEPLSGYDGEIAKITHYLKIYQEIEIEVIGYTDPTGTDAYNLVLSKKRAQSLKRIFTESGILPERIHIKAGGKYNRFIVDETFETRALSRRVEYKVLNNNKYKN